MLQFEGLTALVTGSTSGIGRAIADALHDRGARVIRHGHSTPDDAHDADTNLIREDLAQPGAGRRLGEQALAIAPVDILILSASLQIRAGWAEITPEESARQFQVNLHSALELIQTVVPGMAERGFGRVLTIGSVQEKRPHPQLAAYAASKAAQLNLVINLAKQLAPHGVTVNNLAPGVIDTPRNTHVLADDAYRAETVAKIPVGRIGVTDDCVAPALLLVSREAGFLTGQDLYVDGGQSL